MQAELLARAKKGDQKAFSRLIEAELPKLRRITRHMIGHPDDSEHVLQDAIIKVWEGLDRFEERSAFSTWIASIITRVAVDHLRRQKRWRTEAQVAYANLCAGSEVMSGEVVATASAIDFCLRDARTNRILFCLLLTFAAT